ncbi:DUF2490 domain-containing protein [Flavobacterium sp. N3904]|uniref:DUF2490 domain-containing protein n=1 Tax=Flavobacterium sp. N3904 TaxID=2986835 RepID=UPI0022256F7D|nr:DUF2490 domain-containing protein [Flavobacterium sp. N3904]
MQFPKSLFFTLMISSVLFAQTEKTVIHQSMLWTRYYNILNLNEKWSIHSEIENRIFTDPIKESSIDVRFQGRYKLNEFLEMGAGLAYFVNPTDIPNTNDKFYIGDYRLQQDIILKQNIGSYGISNRLQLDERWIENSNKQGLTSGTTLNLRLRYRFQVDHVFWKKEAKYFKGIIYDEIMFNIDHNVVYNTFDQNRIYIAGQMGFNKSLSLELGYMKAFQQRPNGYEYLDRDIIRITFYQKLNL